MTSYILAFDFSLSSTGWCFLERGSPKELPKLIDSGLINTSWAIGNWRAPRRYLNFFHQFDRLLRRLRKEYGSKIYFAAEAVVWNAETTPALFALHQRFWEWASRLETRIVYLAWARWYHLMVERSGVEKHVKEIEGKSLAKKVFQDMTGQRPRASDESDAWGVGIAADRFFSYLDGDLTREELTPKERQFFDTSTSKKAPSGRTLEVPTGLMHEKERNYFDWRPKNGKKEAGDAGLT